MKESKDGRDFLPNSTKVYPSMKKVPIRKDEQEWKDFMWENILKKGIHKHIFTCKKPPSGKHKCCGGYPVASNKK